MTGRSKVTDIELLKYLYYEKNMTYPEIAKEMKVSRASIWRAVKRNGLKARPNVLKENLCLESELGVGEIWKPIFGYEGEYEVSSLGRVRSLKYMNTRKTVVMKPYISNSDYFGIHLTKDGKPKKHYIHRLMAEAFIENPDGKEQVNHINGIKQDNRIENLEWVTRSENVKHADKMGLRKNNGENNRHSKLTAEDIRKIRNWRETNPKFFTTTKLGKYFGVKHYTISQICKRKSWKSIV